jgi:hypothetical protein
MNGLNSHMGSITSGSSLMDGSQMGASLPWRIVHCVILLEDGETVHNAFLTEF